MTIYAYARVSSSGQTLTTQKRLLKAAGATDIRAEKVSGVAAKRPALAHLLNDPGPGDVLVVTRLDRLARSVLDLLRVIERVTQVGASFKSLNEPWASTDTPHGRLMLTALGGVAEFERSLILERTNEGRIRALAEGVRFGRRPKLTNHQAREALNRLAAGESLRRVARSYAISHSSLIRRKRRPGFAAAA